MNVSPAPSVTVLIVALFEFHAPTSTMRRLPATVLDGSVTARVLPSPCAEACWMKLGVAAGWLGLPGVMLGAVSPRHTAAIATFRDNDRMPAPASGEDEPPTRCEDGAVSPHCDSRRAGEEDSRQCQVPVLHVRLTGTRPRV